MMSIQKKYQTLSPYVVPNSNPFSLVSEVSFKTNKSVMCILQTVVGNPCSVMKSKLLWVPYMLLKFALHFQPQFLPHALQSTHGQPVIIVTQGVGSFLLFLLWSRCCHLWFADLWVLIHRGQVYVDDKKRIIIWGRRGE